MTFSHEPVTAPASPTLTFSSKTIPSATYSESNGAAQITVNTTTPLIASFSKDGRTITLAPAKSQIASTAPPARPRLHYRTLHEPPRSRQFQLRRNAATSPWSTPAMAARTGAKRLAPRSPKKMSPWPSRGFSGRNWRVAASPLSCLRDSDANLSLDDRAFFANSTHAAVYIALHATSTGHGVRVYTSMLPYSNGDDAVPSAPGPPRKLLSCR